MTKAFDVQDLLLKLKSKGLNVAEEAAKDVVESVLDWAGESVVLTENKFDDMVIPFIPQLKAAALAEIDKIDGEVG
jgi:hypothetical protein